MINIEKIKERLLLQVPFFGYVLLHLDFKEVDENEMPLTWATDGNTMWYTFKMHRVYTEAEYTFIFMHELEHVIFQHPWRRGYRNAIGIANDGSQVPLWGLAVDYAVNADLLDFISKDTSLKNIISAPKGLLFEKKYSGLTPEQIYDLMIEEARKEGQLKNINTSNNKDGNDSFCNAGLKPATAGSNVTSANSKPVLTEEDWKGIIVAISQQVGQGNLPAGVERLVNEIIEPKVDYREACAKFVSEAHGKDDYTYSRPRKKYISHGLYFPDHEGNEITLAVAVDTSGSIGDDILKKFVGGELARGICSIYKKFTIYLFSCDAAIHLNTIITESTSEEELLQLNFGGGGGTDFRPVFEEIEKRRLPISCLIFMTDTDGSFPEDPPRYPVLWIVTRKDAKTPFGTIIPM